MLHHFKIALFLLVAVLLTACSKVSEVTPEQAAQLFKDNKAIIVDVREQDEWNEQHIDGAIFIPLGEVESRLGELAAYKDSQVIMQCRSGRRSEKAAKMLMNAGFDQVYNLKGGILAWDEAQLETVKGAN